MSRDALRDTFFSECEDLLDAVATGLSDLAGGEAGADTIHAVFRAVHSIKGAAGAFGMDALVAFAHRFETALDAAREGRLDLDAAALSAFSRGGDVLAALVEAARAGDEGEVEDAAGALAEIDALIGLEPEAEGTGGGDFEWVPLAFDTLGLDAAPPSRWEIAFAPRRAFYENGHDPLAYLQALAELGTPDVECDLSRLPTLAEIDPEEAYLSWRVTLETERTLLEIEEVFAFAEGLCELSVQVAEPAIGDTPGPLAGEPAAQLAEAPPPEPPSVPEVAAPVAAPKIGAKGDAKGEAGEGARPTLRVEIDRVDRLVNSVGELIINQATLAERMSRVQGGLTTELVSGLDDYRLLARQIQDAVMAIRAQPVRPLFQRMARVVREAARATGKSVELVTMGEGTEVDRTVVESLADPLTHMVRNAVDHGLEPPERRREAGKPETGTVWLSAEHESGSVVIRVRDDGAGLDRERIRASAVKKGLIAPEAELSPEETDNLLFMPGFSTAAAVTNLSGRGVGLDVVKTAITRLGGRIGIETVPGQGSTFSLVLPLTLAVLDGMLVEVGGQTAVIPLSAVVETIRPDASQLRSLGREGQLLALRGAHVPVVDLAGALGRREGPFRAGDHILLLVRSQRGTLSAFAVDGITDQRQVVIKSLRDNWGPVPGVSAATVLGDGRVALILDPDALGQGPGLARCG